jgi:hypothetical protein
MSTLEGARQWCARGYYPVPIPYREKGPKLENWQNLRLTAEQVPDYFNGQPQNIGVLQGEPYGSCDIDLDCLQALLAWPHFAPETGLIFGHQSKPDSHWFYRIDPPHRSVKFIDPIDHATLLELRCLKADGGTGLQTLVPPSTHPSGEPIEFCRDGNREPANVDAEELGRAVRWTAAVALLARHWPAAQGGRHDAFLSLAGALAHAQWEIAEATQLVCALYQVLWPGSADLASATREVESTYQSHDDGHEVTGLPHLLKLVAPAAVKCAAKWLALRHVAQAPPKSQPESWEDPISFQSRAVPAIEAECIPGALGDMACAVAKATETPIELAGLLGMSVASSCIAKKAIVQIEEGYFEPVSIYAAPAMESGNRKTSVFQRMTKPLVDWEYQESRRLEPEIKRATSECKTTKARIDQLRAKASKSPLNTSVITEIANLEVSMPLVPTPPRLWVQDVMPEQLAVLMEQQRERMAIFSDEGGIFDILAGRYTGMPNLDVVLQGHSGSPVRVDRVTRGPVMLQNPILTIGISPQPDVLERLSDTPGFRGRGLLARFLYALPASPLGSRSLVPAPCPAETVEAYRKLIERLLKLAPPESEGRWQPWTLKLSEGAYDTWKNFQRTVEAFMKDGGKLEYLRDWASKLPGAAARIAGVFHCVTNDLTETVIVDSDTMQKAVNLATLLIDHALATFDLMGHDKTAEDAQKLLAWIQRERLEAFTVRDCFRAHRSRFKRVEALRPALALLVEHGHLRRAPKQAVAHRPSESYEVNPKVLEASE